MRWCVLLLAALLLGGCLMENMAPERRLRDAVIRLNDGMRWSRTDVALPHVDEEYRPRFVRSRQQWGRVVRIADTEILSLELADDPDEATAVVAVRWYSQSTMRLHETRIEQRWNHNDGGRGYQLVEERIAGGNTELLAGHEDDTAGGEEPGGEEPAGDEAAEASAVVDAEGAADAG